MKAYNDYIQTTREYLRRYNEFKTTLANLKEELTEGEAELTASPAAGIARYGEDPGGGMPELNGVEAGAARLMMVTKRVNDLRDEISRLEKMTSRIDRALEVLEKPERGLIEEYYIERRAWADIARDNFVSERWIKTRGFKALKKVAGMLFGRVADPGEKRKFVFLEIA